MRPESEEQERIMKARLLVAAAATVLIGTAVPVLAEEIGVGVGPVGVLSVTVTETAMSFGNVK